MTNQKFIDAVAQGATTTEEIAEALDLSTGHVSRELARMAREGTIGRERDGHSYVYHVPDEGSSPAATTTSGDGIMPVVRDYDWDADEFHPRPQDYFATDGELKRALATVKNRDVTGQPVRILIDGPTGCGKTTLAEVLADVEDAVFVTVQMAPGMSTGDLLGSPMFAGGDTVWVDGPVTKALLASRERPVVLLVDEVNRAPAHVKNALFSALDHRATVRLDGPRGGEVISGDPLNLMVVATINQGGEYTGTQRMDRAEKDRYTQRFSVDYLTSGPDDARGRSREAELLVTRTNTHYKLALDMVGAVAHLRGEAKDTSNQNIRTAPSTRSVLAWAGAAEAYAAGDVDSPVLAAAEDTIIRPIYGDEGDGDAFDEALGIIGDALDDVPWEEADYDVETADEEAVCGDCGYTAPAGSDEFAGMMAAVECPDCGSVNVGIRDR